MNRYLGLFYLLLCFSVFPSGYQGDLEAWKEMIDGILTHGVSNYYHNFRAPYMPVLVYLLKGFGEVVDAEYYTKNLYIFKLLPLIFHGGISWVIWHMLKAKGLAQERTWLFTLNVAILYNAYIWGQIDDIPTLFLVIGLYALMLDTSRIGIFVIAGALTFLFNTKPQFGIFFSPILIYLLYKFSDKKSWLIGIGSALTLQFLLFIPFLHDLPQLWEVMSGSVDLYNFVSNNAHNLQSLFLSNEKYYTRDSEYLFAGLTYKKFGFLLFFGQYILLLGSLAWVLFRSKKNDNHFQLLILVLILAGLQFFLFPTQIHERYAHPAIILAGLYAILFPSRLHMTAYVIISIAYFINLEDVLRFRGFPNYSILLLDRRFAAGLYLGVYLYFVYEWIKCIIVKKSSLSPPTRF
jgi:Gpi18-like mannosyltransferase